MSNKPTITFVSMKEPWTMVIYETINNQLVFKEKQYYTEHWLKRIYDKK